MDKIKKNEFLNLIVPKKMIELLLSVTIYWLPVNNNIEKFVDGMSPFLFNVTMYLNSKF